MYDNITWKIYCYGIGNENVRIHSIIHLLIKQAQRPKVNSFVKTCKW